MSVPCGCGRVFDAPESLVGGLARCPACGRESVVAKPGLPEVLVVGDQAEWRAVGETGRSGGCSRGFVIAMIVLGIAACVLPYAAHCSPEVMRRAQCTNNLKMIALSLHDYQSAHGTLPPAAIVGKDGKPLLSWRVAILPFIEQRALYEKFHLDEPWNSPHNLTLLDARPSVYKCPSHQSGERGRTEYQAVVAADAAFTPDFKPLRFEDITDGLSHTILVGESRHAVPWTKPDDFPRDLASFDGGFGSFHLDGFNVMMGDGFIRFIPGNIDTTALRAMLTRAGNEAVER